MARKKAPKLVVSKPQFAIPETKLTKATRKFVDQIRAHGNAIAADSQERRAFESYIDALIRYEVAWAYWMTLGDKPKDMDHFNDVSNEVGRLGRIMFNSFDGWQATAKRTFHVPVADVKQIVYDALMTNADALPDFEEMSGLERGRAFKQVADDLIELLKKDRVQITEQDMDAPYCDPCLESMAA